MIRCIFYICIMTSFLCIDCSCKLFVVDRGGRFASSLPDLSRLGGGFKYCLFLPLLGEMIQFD